MRLTLFLTFFSLAFSGFAQNEKPRLVVGIVIDQMRWDFLYRYHDRYKEDGGFRRMMDQGFNCQNTFIPYAPTVTACGHTTVYTGTVPAVHGITGNSWWSSLERRSVYCTEDGTVEGVGIPGGWAGKQSPRNMLTTTISDELRLATNFRSKVIGVAIKDRGGILPAGHSANAAYWYDGGSGKWISSTYYMKKLPDWVQKFNDRKLGDAYLKEGWKTLYPLATYVQSSGDEKDYEARPLGKDAKGFPYSLKEYIGKNYGVLNSTPHGNSFTMEMAKAAIEGESLGSDAITDLLAVSFSSPDYIGHSFGPNSIEIEDTYLRLDAELGEFFDYLDEKIGKGKWVSFLTADHGVAHIPGFMEENRLPGRSVSFNMDSLNRVLQDEFNVGPLVLSMSNYQAHLDHHLMDSAAIDAHAVKTRLVKYFESLDFVSRAYLTDETLLEPMPARVREMFANGFFPTRSGDVQVIFKPHYISGGSTGTTHGLWNPYDSHIPLLWYGWNIKPGTTTREIYMTDIAPTLAALLRIQVPGGSVGTVITEITDGK